MAAVDRVGNIHSPLNSLTTLDFWEKSINISNMDKILYHPTAEI